MNKIQPLSLSTASDRFDQKIAARAKILLALRLDLAHRNADRIFAVLMAVQWAAGIAAALTISPRAWSGVTNQVHIHVWLAFFLGGALSSLPIGLAIFAPGRTITRQIIAASQMLWSALLIHLTEGRIETHFHIFGSLAFLAFYKDWRVIFTATVVVATDHAVRGAFLPLSVYGISAAPWWRFLEHAGWVVFEDIVLLLSIRQSIAEMCGGAIHQAEIEESREEVENKVRERTAELNNLNEVLQATAAEARQSEEKFRHILTAAADAIISVDDKGTIIELSRAAEEMFGYTRAELIGSPINTIVPPRLREKHAIGFNRFQTSGERHLSSWHAVAFPGLAKDGREIPMEISLSTWAVTGNRCLTAVMRDITGRLKTDEEMRRVSEENQRLLTSITSVLFSFDGAGRLTKWNRAAADLFGISSQDAIGRSLDAVANLWDNKALTAAIENCLALRQAVDGGEFACKRPGGSKAILAISITPLTGSDGGVEGVLVLGTDITDRRDLERQLAHAQKLESVGQLAAGIAHEINTPIQYIGDNVSFLRESFGELQSATNAYRTILAAHKSGTLTPTIIDAAEHSVNGADLDYLAGEIPQAIGQSLDGLEHVAKIVRAMKEFSHPDSDSKTFTDLNRAIESTITVARNEWKYVAEVVVDLDPQLPLIPCYPGEFNQVLLNLIVNAAHAISDRNGNGSGDKGTITLSTCHAADGVFVRVKDTGTGIPEAARSKIFDPFFTTKPVGKGTGQGLTIAHAVVVNKHGGTLTFDTEIGSGTTFTIWLPLAQPTTVTEAANAPMSRALT